MNGDRSKTSAITFVLLLAGFFPVPSLAENLDRMKIYSSGMGCMTCHQGKSMADEQASNISREAGLDSQNPAETAETEQTH